MTKLAAIVALALAIAAAAPATAATPTPAPTHVIQAPPHLGPAELSRLTEVLMSADGAAVVLRVPGPATIAASETDLRALWSAVHEARFYIVQQGDAKLDGAAAILSAFAAATFRPPGADPPSGASGALWPVVERLTGCPEPCARPVPTKEAPEEMGLSGGSPATEVNLAGLDRHLADLLDEPTPAATTRPPALDDDGGAGPVPILAGLLILIGGGVTAAAARRHRDAEERPITPDRPEADPPPARPGPPAPRAPARSGRGRRARVVSVLDPEGYVELDRCLQRARWASAGTPAAPGEWVDIETRGRRLWAYAAARPN